MRLTCIVVTVRAISIRTHNDVVVTAHARLMHATRLIGYGYDWGIRVGVGIADIIAALVGAGLAVALDGTDTHPIVVVAGRKGMPTGAQIGVVVGIAGIIAALVGARLPVASDGTDTHPVVIAAGAGGIATGACLWLVGLWRHVWAEAPEVSTGASGCWGAARTTTTAVIA